jgi:uncharacterized protein (DUF1015 family)
VPRFEPFAGLRYDPARSDLAAVTAPPYDVIDDEQRAALAGRDPHNIVHLDLPVDEDGVDRYRVACARLRAWRDEGVLVLDETPVFYVYRMDHHDDEGGDQHTTGVIGALELSRPGEGGILPHEHTTPKAKTDRLEMLRSCEANLSPIWGLSTAPGLTDLCHRADDLLGDWTDDDGVRHRLWRVAEPDLIDAIATAVSAAPVVIADGHHRYETSLAYRDERRAAAAAGGDKPADYDLTMTFVVELAEDELTVRPIHRLVAGLPDDLDLVAALADSFAISPTDPADEGIGSRLAEAGALGLVTRDGTWLLQPRADLEARAGRDHDSSRHDAALAGLPDHQLTFQHGVANVVRAVDKGDAQAGILLRPATVAQIIEIADGGDRMPPKTTFFHPKPRTGLVVRPL